MIGIYTNSISAHLWYLYAYMVFLMCHPLLRAMVKGFKPENYIYILMIYFGTSLISLFNSKIGVSITSYMIPN